MIRVTNTAMLFPAGLAILLATTLLPTPALAQEGRQNQRFTIVATDISGVGRLVATGAISGVGTDTTISHTANPDGTFTDSDRFDLPGGAVFLSDMYTVQISSEPRSCRSIISIAGTYTVTGGTRTYTGVSGGGTFTASGVLVANRNPAGTCLGFDSEPLAFIETVHGAGTTTGLPTV